MSSNSWNDFEHDHADEGLSQADMSEMYHAEQDAGESSAELNSTTDMNDTSGGLQDNDSGLTQTSEAQSDVDYGSGSTNEGSAETETCNENEESSRSGNQWNDFQHEHAGEGLSHTDMSEMYHAEQDASKSSAELNSTSDMNDTSGNPQANDSGFTQTSEVHSDIDDGSSGTNEGPAETETCNKNEESSRPGNQWNDFQHKHAGEGLSHTDMSEMYHADQKSRNPDHNATPDNENTEAAVIPSDNGSTLSSNTSHAVIGNDSNATEKPDNDIQEPSRNESPNQNINGSTEGNQWNDFQHEHKNQALNQQQMAALYHQQQLQQQQQEQPQQQQQQQPQQEQTTDNTKVGAAQFTSNEWNKFEHEHKNQGLNQQQMAALYHQQQQQQQQQQEQPQQQQQQQPQQEPTTDNTKVGEAQFTSNEWNKFEHEHKNQGLNQQQMAALYHQQQQQQQQQRSQQEPTTDNTKIGAAQFTSNEWNKFEHEHKNQGLNQQQMAALYHQQQQQQQQQPQQEPTADNTKVGEVQFTSNEWNKFEHEHKNQGLNQQQMAALYHQQQQQQQQQPQQEPTADNTKVGEVQFTSNEWNKFEHEHKNQGLNQQQMAALYHQQQQQQQQQQPQQEQTTDNTKVGAAQSASNEWNKFEHEHKNQGLNQQQMAALYHQKQEQQGRTTNNIAEGSVQTVAKDCEKSEHEQKASSDIQQKHQMQKPKARIQWNVFQHLYGGKHLTKQEMSNKYNQFKENERTFHWKGWFSTCFNA